VVSSLIRIHFELLFNYPLAGISYLSNELFPDSVGLMGYKNIADLIPN
jgi:hypothetical protein